MTDSAWGWFVLAFYCESVVWPFYFVGGMMFLSGLWVWVALSPKAMEAMQAGKQ